MLAHNVCFASHIGFRGFLSRRRGVLSYGRTSSAPIWCPKRSIRALTMASSAAPVDGGPAYDFRNIEQKWQRVWATRGDFRTPDLSDLDCTKPKFYALDMFPYPSGAGLHVGHPEGYTATDIMARMRRKQGHNVLHPMGWDAFGLPAEQYALETGAHPSTTTERNINRFREQLKLLGFSYDWDREVRTTDPGYYRWTQWIFLQLWERGLAYQADIPVNWCPALGTVLANEEVIDGVSERGGHPVERRPMRQWVLRITEYADRLLEDLNDLDWPENIKDMQRNWIGRSVGAEIDFPVRDSGNRAITVYTSRPETICGASYLVVAPEWDGLADIVSEDKRSAVLNYIESSKRKSDRERTGEGASREKSGIFTGAFALNPLNGEELQVWVADYVLGSYGTGAIMAVPAHDSRDFEFAVSHSLPVKPVIEGGKENEPFLGDGNMINWPSTSELHLNGVSSKVARELLVGHLESTGLGRRKVNYKLRDWLFSRQRYWGEPFPIIFVDGEPRPVPEADLPVTLPEVKSYHPSGSGKSPLANETDWVSTIDPVSQMPALRETNTMPQWAGSCWYYLRFIDPKNVGRPIDPKLEKYWMPVDLYIGGVEHAVLHLLYARFWHKVLFDVGVVSTKEPFQKLVNQGMILGEVEYTAYRDHNGEYVSLENVDVSNGCCLLTGDEVQAVQVQSDEVEKSGDFMVLSSNRSVRVAGRAQKMSKSRGNVVNPDVIVNSYGADSLRCYLMFMGPLEQVKPWRTTGVQGMSRFLSRSWRLVVDQESGELSARVSDAPASTEQKKVLHQMIKKVTTETNALRFNTAISGLMEFVNSATKWESRPREVLNPFISILGIYAPHVAEELWQRVGHTEPLAHAPWPVYRDDLSTDEKTTIVVQVNGKVREKFEIPCGLGKEEVLDRAIAGEKVQRFLKDSEVVRTIYVPNKLVNIVVKKQTVLN